LLRDTGSRVCARVDELPDAEIATSHPIGMEVLADAHVERLERHTLLRVDVF
jgi:hypothetical protein